MNQSQDAITISAVVSGDLAKVKKMMNEDRTLIHVAFRTAIAHRRYSITVYLWQITYDEFEIDASMIDKYHDELDSLMFFCSNINVRTLSDAIEEMIRTVWISDQLNLKVISFLNQYIKLDVIELAIIHARPLVLEYLLDLGHRTPSEFEIWFDVDNDGDIMDVLEVLNAYGVILSDNIYLEVIQHDAVNSFTWLIEHGYSMPRNINQLVTYATQIELCLAADRFWRFSKIIK
jgi:hypothetical protein